MGRDLINANHASDSKNRERLILLGASNVAIGFPTILKVARERLGNPLDVYAAFAFGRSYGLRSNVLFHSYPGIINCGIWQAIDQHPAPTIAVITDVGNDILYGASVDQIINWVSQCLISLKRVTDEIALTELPWQSISRVGNLEFLLMRKILFPGCKLSRAATLQRANELNLRLRTLKDRFHFTLHKPRREWFGLDPIHLLRRHRRVAWEHYLSGFLPRDDKKTLKIKSFRDSLPFVRLRCEKRCLFSRPQYRPQPCTTLHDGTRLFLY